MYDHKKESAIILACILSILLFYFIYWIITSFASIINKKELFGCRNSGNSKRDKMTKIYKSNEVSDPDEIVNYNPYDDECDDPDGDCGHDPDS